MFYNVTNLIQGCEFMEENKLSIQKEISNEEIKNLIYTIRGKQVMLDSDVAMLYHYETKNVNQAVKRNIDRFPERFCFQLTERELEIMWSQIVTTSKLENNKYRSKKYLPYIDIQKFNKEYPVLKIAKTNKFHDRFIVLDNEEMYHLGASIKDLGKKCFGINKIEDKEIIEKIINL